MSFWGDFGVKIKNNETLKKKKILPPKKQTHDVTGVF
jgi:hypothetical protein